MEIYTYDKNISALWVLYLSCWPVIFCIIFLRSAIASLILLLWQAAFETITKSCPPGRVVILPLNISLAIRLNLFLRVASLKWAFEIDTPNLGWGKSVLHAYKAKYELESLLPFLNTFLKSLGFLRRSSLAIVRLLKPCALFSCAYAIRRVPIWYAFFCETRASFSV